MKFLKIAGIILILVSAVIWAAKDWYLSDEKINPEVVKFFPDDPFDPKDNFYVALAAFNAPPEIGNIYDYGLKIAKGEISLDRENTLLFQGDIYIIACHGSQRQPRTEEQIECADLSEVEDMYQKNRQLVERYQSFYNYGKYNLGDNAFWEFSKSSNQSLININRLLNAHRSRLAQTGEARQALTDWFSDTIFIQKILKEKHTFVDHAVFMILYNNNLKSLPVLLENDPALIPEWHEKLETALSFNSASPDIWANVMRGEYLLVEMIIPKYEDDSGKTVDRPVEDYNYLAFLRPNTFRNRFYSLAKDMIRLVEQPASKFYDNYKTFILDPYANQFKNNPFNYLNRNLIGELFLSDTAKGGELIANAYNHNAQSRMLILYLKAKNQNLSPENMPEFLKKSPSSLHDPFTERPFRWDEKEKSMFFAVSNDSKTRRKIFYEK